LLDATAAIASATSALVGIGAHIQKTRVNALADLNKARTIKTDPTALNALINAAKETTTTIQSLASATKASATKLDEKALAQNSNSVTNATAHLVAALKAGSSPQEAEMITRLTVANEQVSEATSALMSAVHRAAQFNETVDIDVSADVGKVKELEIQIRILKLEKSIKREQKKLEAMKHAQKKQLK